MITGLAAPTMTSGRCFGIIKIVSGRIVDIYHYFFVMLTYRSILSKSWTIAWHHPRLWVFGFFAYLFGTGVELELVTKAIDPDTNQTIFGAFLNGVRDAGLISQLNQPGALSGAAVISTLAVPAVLALLVVIIFVIGLIALVWCQGALISESIAIGRGKPNGLAGSLAVGRKRFWTMLGLDAMLFVVFGAMNLPLWFVAGNVPLAVFLPIFVVMVGVSVVIAMVIRYAMCAAVLEGMSLVAALRRATEVIRRQWLLTIELVVVLLVITSVVNIGFGTLFTWLLEKISVLATASLVLPNTLFVCLIIFAGFVSGVLAAWQWTVWAVTFELLTSSRVELRARLLQWFSRSTAVSK
jgi:hypothetical protein